MSHENSFERPEATLTPLERRRLRFRKIPIRIVLPNLVTLLALSMGLTAIRYAVEGKFETAVLAVIAAAVLDGLDGRLARGQTVAYRGRQILPGGGRATTRLCTAIDGRRFLRRFKETIGRYERAGGRA